MTRGPSLSAGLVLLMCGTTPSLAGASRVPPEALQICSDLRVVVNRGRDVRLEVLPGVGDDAASIAHRIAADPGQADAPTLRAGRWVGLPAELLSPEMRSLALRNLFPLDRRDGDDWLHVARSGVLPTYDEGLWQVALWFTGRGSDFEELQRINRLPSPELKKGQTVRVPARLLDTAFLARPKSDDGMLEYDADDAGPHAVYRLRKGEALYSAVVVRFTGRTEGDDVGAVARQVGERSGILDLHDIPVGFEVKIPLDLLEPEFLPFGHPRRIEAEALRDELAQELQRQPVTGAGLGLAGALIVLDPGHGGRDLGTIKNGIWEHDYVYDVTCRLKKKLEQGTAARVVMTLEDRETGCEPSRTDTLVRNLQGTILTTPPFLPSEQGEAKMGVNLRWYLANSVYRDAVQDGFDSDRVIFISMHADSRHPALRGLMVYVPGADYRAKTYGDDSGPYRQYREVREQPFIKFSRKERVRSEAVSRKLADAIVASFGRQKLPIQPHQPVRDKVVKGKQKYVPAVLRGNAVPTKVLVEMVNLGNTEDAALLKSASERDRLAAGLVDALYDHFGETPSDVAAATPALDKRRK